VCGRDGGGIVLFLPEAGHGGKKRGKGQAKGECGEISVGSTGSACAVGPQGEKGPWGLKRGKGGEEGKVVGHRLWDSLGKEEDSEDKLEESRRTLIRTRETSKGVIEEFELGVGGTKHFNPTTTWELKNNLKPAKHGGIITVSKATDLYKRGA